jgi:hypothetical protein
VVLGAVGKGGPLAVMPGDTVGDFMSQNHGELVVGAGEIEHGGGDNDFAAGDNESVGGSYTRKY